MADEPDDDVTPAMLEAGANVLREFFPRITGDDATDLAEAIYRAMLYVAPTDAPNDDGPLDDSAYLEGSDDGR
jgi:hypothetical protein